MCGCVFARGRCVRNKQPPTPASCAPFFQPLESVVCMCGTLCALLLHVWPPAIPNWKKESGWGDPFKRERERGKGKNHTDRRRREGKEGIWVSRRRPPEGWGVLEADHANTSPSLSVWPPNEHPSVLQSKRVLCRRWIEKYHSVSL